MWTRTSEYITALNGVTTQAAKRQTQPLVVHESGGGHPDDYSRFIHSLRVYNRHTLAGSSSASMISPRPDNYNLHSLPQERQPSPSVLSYDVLSKRSPLLKGKLQERTFEWLRRRGLSDIETLFLLGLIGLDVICNTVMFGLHREISHRFLVDIFGFAEIAEVPLSCLAYDCLDNKPDKIISTALSTSLSCAIYSVVYLNQAFGLFGILRQRQTLVTTFTTVCILQAIFLVFGVLAMPVLVPVTVLRCCLFAAGLRHSLTLSDRHYRRREAATKAQLDMHSLRVSQEEDRKKIKNSRVQVNVQRPQEDESIASLISKVDYNQTGTGRLSLPGGVDQHSSTGSQLSSILSSHRDGGGLQDIRSISSNNSSLSSINDSSVGVYRHSPIPIRSLMTETRPEEEEEDESENVPCYSKARSTILCLPFEAQSDDDRRTTSQGTRSPLFLYSRPRN